MRYFTISVALLLGACGGFNSKQEFLQDKQNMNKSIELANKHTRSADCDKLGQLYEFTQQKTPTTDDLAKILPLLGSSSKDATDIDKIYKIDYSIIDKYYCTDNTKQLLSERTRYCKNKYYDEYGLETAVYFPFRLVSTVSVLTIIGAIPFAMTSCGIESAWHPIMCKQAQGCYKYLSESINDGKTDYSGINKQTLKQNLEHKIKSIWPTIQEEDIYLLEEFTPSELIKAKQTVMGMYDKTYLDVNNNIHYNCDLERKIDGFCDDETGQITQFNIINVLYYSCMVPSAVSDPTCLCYAHEMYKKINYKNLLYIHENRSMPESKQTESDAAYDKCDKKITQQRINAEKSRYGEAYKSNNAFGEFVAETLMNSIYVTQKANEQIRKMREAEDK